MNNKKDIQKDIDSLFSKNDFTPDEIKKIKKKAMRYRIRLGEYRKRFCKYCLNPLGGKIRITKEHKNIVCAYCSKINRQKII